MNIIIYRFVYEYKDKINSCVILKYLILLIKLLSLLPGSRAFIFSSPFLIIGIILWFCRKGGAGFYIEKAVFSYENTAFFLCKRVQI